MKHFLSLGVRFGAASAVVIAALSTYAIAADDRVVATVDGEKIMRSELEDLREHLAAQMPQIAKVPFDEVLPGLVERAIDRRLVDNKAVSAKLDKDPKVLQRLKQLKAELIAQVWLSREVAKRVDDAKVRAAYDAFLKEHDGEEEVHARHILTKTKAAAEAAIKKLKSGASFEEVAKTDSIGPSNAHGGDLGYFKKDAMVPEFAKAAFALKKGAISEHPVKTQFGWHAIKVEDRRRVQQPTFETIQETLRGQLGQKAVSDILTELRQAADVKVLGLKDKKDATAH